MIPFLVTLAVLSGLIVCVVIYDLIQRKHAILRNFPLIGHLRFLLEAIGPELRQYIVTDNDSERPFSRDQRRWIYASSKKQNNYFGFGTDNDLELAPNDIIIKHSSFALDLPHPRPRASGARNSKVEKSDSRLVVAEPLCHLPRPACHSGPAS